MAEWVGMLLHWYQRSVDDENMSALTAQWVPRAQLTREFLHQTREDVLYRYRR